MAFEILKSHRTFEGTTHFCQHESESTKTTMKFSVFLPQEIGNLESAIIWLSGLTCTDENFITKAGAQRYLAGTKTMVICPDTSPRGVGAPGEDDAYDFGSGAGFYVNAVTDGYSSHYQMYDYILKDVMKLLKEDFKVNKVSISGHSMGGHGALILGLNNPESFISISAFSPIVNPTQCPWGKKALNGYLGDHQESWSKYDACLLLESGQKHSESILIDQGLADEFFEEQLLTKNFEQASEKAGQAFEVNYREGYDHSYYFISTFIENHINFHLKNLNN